MQKQRLRRYLRHGMFPQLVAFEACIRHGSVTRAAEELSLAQPTVSCLVKKLSDTLGGPLTMTRDRRIEATPLGVELLALCHEVFDAFESFDARRERDRDGSDGSGSGDDPDAIADVSPGPSTTTLETLASYDRRAALSGIPPWLSPYPQRKLSRSKPRALRCPQARRRPSETTGES